MSLFTSVVSRTVGRIVPKFRTIAEFYPIYTAAVAERGLVEKTIENRKSYSRVLIGAFGERAIGSIKPNELLALIDRIGKKHPHLAKRVLIEARCIFHEAMISGWIETNPAEAVKLPQVKTVRQRLSLDQWQSIHDYADCCSPPWVALMMTLAVVTGQRRGDLRKMRFSDVWEDRDGVMRLHVVQEKTGKRVAIPVDLRLDAIDVSVGEAVEQCKKYAVLDADGDGYLIRKTTGGMLAATSMSWRFEQAREGALPKHEGKGTPSSLHECRSLSERLYRDQGLDTMTLLGHSSQTMTNLYNQDRGLSRREGKWKSVPLAVSNSMATENHRGFAAA